MWLIGHELRHTIEILSTRSVTSQVDMYDFYSKVGQKQNGERSFETTAAIEAGEACTRGAQTTEPLTQDAFTDNPAALVWAV